MLLLAATLALGACGGDKADPAGGNSTNGGSTQIHAAALYAAQCMRSKGYNMPDPTFDQDDNPVFEQPDLGKGVDPNAYKQAHSECNQRLNQAWAAAGRPNRKEEDRQNLLAFAGCMREHGVNVPDPDAQGGWALDKVLISSPAWKSAAQACRDKLPAGVALPGTGGAK